MKLKRIMAMVLCFAMVLSTMSFSVFAADDYVAYIGEQGYETLQLALEAAKNETDIEINLVADATLDINAWDTLAIGGENTESITINGDGNTLTFNHLNSDWNNVATNNAKLILNDMAITNSGYNNGPWNRHDINFACDVELKNVTSDKALAFKAGAVLDTVSISDANTSDTYAIWIQSNGQTVTITNSTIDMLACTDGRGIKIANEYVENTEKKVTLTVTGTSFKTEEKAAILVCSTKGADITLSDVNINDVEADTQNAVWNDEDTADYLSLIEVTGGTVKQEGAAPVAYVAQIQGGASFASLADAVVAAGSGDTIIILQSGDYEMPKFKDKELTFIGVDKENTTINDWVEKNSQGMSGSTVHFKDLTINGQTANYYGLFHTKGVTYENCNINGLRFLYSPTTFTDCAFDANGVEHSFWTYGASEVTVNNCTFKYTDRAVNCYSEAGADHETDITFEGCTFIYTGTADAPEGAVEINSGSSKSIDLALKDCIAPTKGEMWFNSRWDSKNGANTTVTVDDTQVWPVVVNVATIGDKKYTSLQAAIDAAQTDDVITIISDIVMTTENYVTNSDGYAAMLNVAGKSITIDLNGKDIKVEAAADDLANAKDTMLMAVFAVDTNGALTLIDNIGTGFVDVTANDAKVYSLAAAYGEGGKLNIESGSYTVDKVSSALIYSQYDKAVTVSGGNFRLDNVGTGSNGSPWIVNVSGKGDGYVSITGGTFNANIQRQHWTTEVKVPVSHYMSKNSDDTWTVKEGSAVSVKEGTLCGPYYVPDFEVGYPSLQAFLDAANANVPNTIDSYDPITLLKDCSENINIDIVLNESEENNERTLTLNLNGYQYSGTITLCHKDNVLISGEGLNVVSGVAGYKVQYADGMYTLIEAPKPYIAQVGETKYTDLKEALDACTNGETIMIIDDITYDANDIVYAHGGATGFGNYDQYNPSIIYVGGTKGATPAENQPSNVNAVIDLNGHTITNNADSYLFIIMDNAKVTFTDSLGGGGVVGNSENYPVIWSVGSETLVTIEKGNYITNSALGLLHSTHSGDLVIEGGEFSTTANDASLLIMLNSQKYNNPNYFLKGIATVAIKGGTFHGFNPEKVGDDYGASSIEEIKFVDGCADGFAPIDNGNGIYGVVDYVQWIKDELLAGRDVTLTRDVVVDGSYITSEPHAVNSNGKYPNYGIFTVVGDYDVTIDLNGYDVTYNGHANFEWNGKTYNSCTVAHGLFFANGGADLTIKDSAGTSDITVYGLASGAYVATPNTTLTIEGGKWKNVGCATCGGTNIFLYPLQGGELYITDGHFDQALDSEGESYLIVEHGGAYANSVIDYSKTKVEISGGTFVGMNPAEIKKFNQTVDNKLDMTTEPQTNGCAEGYEPKDNGDGTYGIVKENIAKIGDVLYNDLAIAVEEVKSGETITLTKDVKIGTGIKVASGKNFTLDLGGFTYTIASNPVGSKGTETLGFQLLKDSNITIKNGTITSETGSGVKLLVMNYANLTLDGVTLDGTNLDDVVNAGGYVMSNNNGTTVIKDSTITAPTNGFAFDVDYQASYPDGAKVSLEGNTTINGAIVYEENAQNSLVKDTTVTADAPDGYKWSMLNGAEMTLVPVVGYSFELVADKEKLYEKGEEVIITLNVNSTDADTFYSISGKLGFDDTKLEYTGGASTNGTIKVQQMYPDENGEGFAVGTYKTFTFKVLENIAVDETLTFTMNGMVVGTYDDAFTDIEDLEEATETVDLVAPYTVTLPEELTGETTVIHGNEYVVSVKVPDELHKNTTYTITYTCGENTGSKVVTADDSTFTVPAEDIVGPLSFEFTSENKLEVEVKNNFVTGHTLILVKGDAKGYLFNDNGTNYAMYQVGNYKYGENNDMEARAWVVKGEMTKEQAFDLITIDEENESVKIAEGYNVNAYAVPDGEINFLDATAAHASYQIRYDIPAKVRAYLASDVNADYQVTSTDVNAILTHADYVE